MAAFLVYSCIYIHMSNGYIINEFFVFPKPTFNYIIGVKIVFIVTVVTMDKDLLLLSTSMLYSDKKEQKKPFIFYLKKKRA